MRACCALVRSTLAAALAAALTAATALATLGLAAAATRAATLATALDTLGLAAAALDTLGLAAAATLDAGLAAGLTDKAGGRALVADTCSFVRMWVPREILHAGATVVTVQNILKLFSLVETRSAHSKHSLAPSTRRAVGRTPDSG